jgi:chloramphenicol O-acetyltransferase type B
MEGQPEYLAAAGKYIYGKPRVRAFGINGKVTLGSYISISEDVTFYLGGNHRIDWMTTFPFPAFGNFHEVADKKDFQSTNGDITIGSDVWIGEHAIILSGVTVGHGAVIGAYSVVGSDVDPYAIMIGNPAEILRYRFSRQQCDALLDIAWWDWPDEKLREALTSLCSTDVDGFIKWAEGRK